MAPPKSKASGASKRNPRSPAPQRARKAKKVALSKKPGSKRPEKGLLIRQPWIDKILKKQKTWELRNRPTNIRGSIGLMEVGSSKLVGRADLVDCFLLGRRVNDRWVMKRHVKSLSHTFKKHRCRPEDVRKIGYTTLYAWVFRRAAKYSKPVSQELKPGSMVWCDLRA